MKTTIKSILAEMKKKAESNQIQSPVWWINKADDLSSLWQDLKDELTKAEIAFLREVERIENEEDCSHTRAETKAKVLSPKEGKMNEYQLFKYLKGRDEIIGEKIKLAKKRATMEEY